MLLCRRRASRHPRNLELRGGGGAVNGLLATEQITRETHPPSCWCIMRPLGRLFSRIRNQRRRSSSTVVWGIQPQLECVAEITPDLVVIFSLTPNLVWRVWLILPLLSGLDNVREKPAVNAQVLDDNTTTNMLHGFP